MARFYGEIGFGAPVETVPGVWGDGIIGRKFFGTVLRNTLQSTTTDKVNDDNDLSTTISIVASKYLRDNLKAIRYIKFEGEYWEIDSVEVGRPRLILSLGGVYNGPKAAAPDPA